MTPGPIAVAADGDDITWEADLPLLRGSEVLGDLVKVFAISGGLVALLLSLLLATSGEAEQIPMAVAGSAVLAGVLLLIGLLASGLLFGGRMRFRYVVDRHGIRITLVDRRARAVNRLTLVAGVLAGKPGGAGTGLIAIGQEEIALEWDGAFRATLEERRRTITFRNAWRRLVVVHVTPDLWSAVVERIQAEMRVAGTEARASRRTSPLPRILGLSVAAVVASLACFPLADAFDVDLFPLILVLCFAVATIWLVSLFAWVVFGGLILIDASVVISLLEVRTSMFFPGETYRGFDVLGDGDIAALVLALVGQAVLLAMGRAALRGRLPSMLERDMDDQG